MAEPLWVTQQAVLILHNRSIALHGGAQGIRDLGLLSSALERPKNRFYYEQVEGIAELAATYAVAISNNHPFVDGNKRAAFQCLTLFLRENGLRLTASQADAALTTLALAAGKLDLDRLSHWVSANLGSI